MSTKSPKVSIILPTYNGQQYIKKSIESCLNQTYQNIELIIVDDASTDETPNIIRQYAERDSRIRAITNKKNKKLPGSLNIGHEACSGDLITWTSDDNFYRDDAIEIMANYLQTHLDIGMVYSDYWIIDSNEEIIKEVKVSPVEVLSIHNCVGPCFLYRKDVYKRVGLYSIDTLYAEDYDYWLRIAVRFSLNPIQETLYSYRSHSNSISSTVKNIKIKDAANFALARNMLHLHWLSTEQKYNRIKRIIQYSLTNSEYRRLPLYFIIAFTISPQLTLKEILKKATSHE